MKKKQDKTANELRDILLDLTRHAMNHLKVCKETTNRKKRKEARDKFNQATKIAENVLNQNEK